MSISNKVLRSFDSTLSNMITDEVVDSGIDLVRNTTVGSTGLFTFESS